MADDLHRGGRVGHQRLRKAIQDRLEVGQDGCAVDAERDVAGDVQLQQVLAGLRHLHTGTSRGFFHGALLLFHLARPDVGADTGDGATDQRTIAHALATGGIAAQSGTDGCADARPGGRAPLGVVHAGASRHQQGHGHGRHHGLTGTTSRGGPGPRLHRQGLDRSRAIKNCRHAVLLAASGRGVR